jgi:hypothetical protein
MMHGLLRFSHKLIMKLTTKSMKPRVFRLDPKCKELVHIAYYKPADVGIYGPSQHTNPTSFEICTRYQHTNVTTHFKAVHTVEELHIAAAGAPLSVRATRFFTTMLVAVKTSEKEIWQRNFETNRYRGIGQK